MRIKIFPLVSETSDDIFACVSSRQDFPCEPSPDLMVCFEPLEVLSYPFLKFIPPAAFRYVKEDLSYGDISRVRGLPVCVRSCALQGDE